MHTLTELHVHMHTHSHWSTDFCRQPQTGPETDPLLAQLIKYKKLTLGIWHFSYIFLSDIVVQCAHQMSSIMSVMMNACGNSCLLLFPAPQNWLYFPPSCPRWVCFSPLLAFSSMLSLLPSVMSPSFALYSLSLFLCPFFFNFQNDM